MQITDGALDPRLLGVWTETVQRTRELLEPTAGDGTDTFNPDRWKALAQVGIQGLPVATEYGGQGADPETIAATVDALGYACPDNGLNFTVGAHLWSAVIPLQRFGSDEQKARYLPGLCDGSLIGVQAMTEPGSGSDAYSLRTTATYDGDDVVLNGSKTFISNAPVADVFVVFASVDRDKGWAGLCAFVVERGAPGLTVSKQLRKLGINSSPFGELHFDDVRVPADNVVGRKGGGMVVFTHSMDWERSFILGPALGTMRRQIERCASLADECAPTNARLVRHKVGEMATRYAVTRLLFHRTAQRRGSTGTKLPDAAMLKLSLSEAWVQTCQDQIDVHAIAGRGDDWVAQADLQDALGSRIYSGTSQIQRDLVAQQLKLP
jgi:alkylation response protein AidB-like acyl-CoA dehydrogenase